MFQAALAFAHHAEVYVMDVFGWWIVSVRQMRFTFDRLMHSVCNVHYADVYGR